jgi:hypothetical protein
VDAALAATDLSTAGVPVHGTRLRRGSGKLADPANWLLARRRAILRRLSARRTGRSVVAADAHTMIDYQHRSPTR